ncbi:threonine/homoserine/homoserine lactone efflux protein [Rhodovulum imhoffii]|uniref:Threonine/homoserine/homoserine lactone efflux protein n=1 Tax=Rhodovulum imhoffii TaxID=365340 RepID=A0A2T5BWY8_9RHOB|nr:LysE family transporter [Rhodovulum imhoffii]MBK5933392.1 hypothetical protein [Rhodovulum imhoffii]PTN04156.1 threonine/homoserine/homoserine lactone efflux protein [Rhodovulum imhoffii]
MGEFQASLLAALALQATAMSVPGQNHFLILSASQQGALVRGLIVVGIATAGVVFSSGAAIAVYFSGQAFSDRIFSILGLLGSGFLVYLGGKSIRSALRRHTPEGGSAAPSLSLGRAFSSGFFVNISNAKSVLFFGAVFATSLPLATMSLGALAFVVLAFFLNSLLVHGAVSALLATGAVRRFTDRRRPLILLVSGCLFLVFAVFSAQHIIGTWLPK